MENNEIPQDIQKAAEKYPYGGRGNRKSSRDCYIAGRMEERALQKPVGAEELAKKLAQLFKENRHPMYNGQYMSGQFDHYRETWLNGIGNDVEKWFIPIAEQLNLLQKPVGWTDEDLYQAYRSGKSNGIDRTQTIRLYGEEKGMEENVTAQEWLQKYKQSHQPVQDSRIEELEGHKKVLSSEVIRLYEFIIPRLTNKELEDMIQQLKEFKESH